MWTVSSFSLGRLGRLGHSLARAANFAVALLITFHLSPFRLEIK